MTEFALFGSVLRDDFRPDSDVDVLLTFGPDSGVSLFDFVDMQDELEAAFGRRVDVSSRRGVERSENPYRRKAILESARVVYQPRTEALIGVPTDLEGNRSDDA
ncbi:hypothetical protein HNQ61_000945 [Longimicrobium terrae]|uniref:Polymerase nucleotidyl transferase domain-containing protein n=1 Tax=Longimicrobium terrae TaxID=1639882 RepID=A0A841GQK1_9BACT|nr:hypothetical protein [Longimicrobium terrae]